jgi:Flp pilus assembly protein TadD
VTAAAVALGFFSMWPLYDIKRDGVFGQTYYRYGKFYFDQGDYEPAISYLTKATEMAPEMYQGFIMLGVAYEEAGQMDTAVDTFWLGTIAAPDRPEMHCNLAIALVNVGRTAEALPPLYRAIELDPANIPAWSQLGEVYITLGDYRRAEMAYRRVVELTPKDGQALYRVAELDFLMGRAAEALAYAHAATEAAPDMPGPGLLIGRIYYQNGDYLAALKYFERESALQPRSTEVLGFLAVSYGRTGDTERARAAYRDFLALGGPHDPTFERDMEISPQ